jgi:hypothetical protein
MFEGWDSFYLLVGGAAGALIGTMFIVATLTAGYDANRLSRGAAVYITPVVFHFGVVMVVSVLTAVPHLSSDIFALVMAVCAAVGVVYAVVTTVRIFRLDWDDTLPDLSDKFFYGVFPTLAYLALGGAAASIWLWPEDAPYLIGATMLILLVVGIRNAWDLATALVQRQRDPQSK